MKRTLAAVLLLSCSSHRPPAVSPTRVQPGTAERVTPDAPFRAEPPFAFKRTAWNPPSIVERRLPNGIRLLVLERHDVPSVAMRIVSDRGTDQASRGIPEVWGEAILRAGEGHPAWEVNEDYDRLALTHHAVLDPDSTQIELRFLSKLFVPVVDLVGALMSKPVVSAMELDRAKSRVSIAKKTGLKDFLGQRAYELMYPPKHPYAEPLAPMDAIPKVTPELVVAYQRAAFTPEHTTLVVVGDVTVADAEKALAKAFAGLAGEKLGAVKPPVVPPLPASTPKILIVNEPDATQSRVSAVWLGYTIGSPDEVPAHMAATLLSEALYHDVRVKKGATYGFHLLMPAGRAPRLLAASGFVQTDRTADAVRDLIGDVMAVGTDPVTEKQLDFVRGDAGTDIPQLFHDMPSAASAIASIVVRSAPLSFYSDWLDRIESVTADEVTRAAHTWLSVDAMRIVIHGDAAKIQAPLAELGIGTIKVLPF